MMRITPLVLLAAVLMPPVHAGDYVQAPGSTLSFVAKYEGEAFTGRFPAFATRLRFDPKSLATSRLDVTIQLAGAATGDADRDSKLRDANFFNIARYPQARFVATRFRALGAGRYAAEGQLTLRGVSRPVTLGFAWTPGVRPVLIGKATVKRLDFGVGSGEWVDTGIIANEVAVSTRVVWVPVK